MLCPINRAGGDLLAVTWTAQVGLKTLAGMARQALVVQDDASVGSCRDPDPREGGS